MDDDLCSPRMIYHEAQYRAAFLIVFMGTVSILYLGSTFIFLFSNLLIFGTSVDHFISAGLLYIMVACIIWITLIILLKCGIRSANLQVVQVPRIKRQVYQLGRKLGIKAIAMASGGMEDKKFSALIQGRHMIVRIGRRRISKESSTDNFKFRIAHELVHLASNDPNLEIIILAFYITTFFSICCTVLIPSAEALIQAARFGGFLGLIHSWNSTVSFAIITNIIALGGIIVILWIENQSASRIREFHADALATKIVGSINIFNENEKLEKKTSIKNFFSRIFQDHPEDKTRQLSIADKTTIFRADRIIFFTHGYLSTLIFESIFQVIFSTTNPSIATYLERRLNFHRLIEANPSEIITIICLFGVLGAFSHKLIVKRLAITTATMQHLSYIDQLQLTINILFFVGAGAIFCLGTNVTILFYLKHLNWDLISYLLVASDLIFIHISNLFILCTILIITINYSKLISDSFRIPTILGVTQVICSLGFGVTIYM